MSRKKPWKRSDTVNYYIHKEMAARLDRILERVGDSNDIKSRSELIGRVLASFLNYYEDTTMIKAEFETHVLAKKLKEHYT